MNYYDAVPLADGSGFHYVSRNRRSGTHAVGYCSPIGDCPEETCRDGFGKEDCPTCEGKGYITTDESHVHATADEARECFRKYLLDGQREESYSDWTGCEVCDKPTKKGLTTRPPLGHGYALCDEHRTPEQLEELAPIVGQIIASY